jgi:hypothetical protein
MIITIKNTLKLIAFLFSLLPIWTWAATYNVSTSTSTVDGDIFCGGAPCTSSDTIIIEGGPRGDLFFRDFDGSGSYITIQNAAIDRVVITHDGAAGWGILSFYNCKYVDFRGDNNAGFTYGIKVVNDGTPSTPVKNIWVYGKSDHIKLGYIESEHTMGATGNASVGIGVGDASLTNSWTFDTFEIHHNYIHDTRYAGMYLGHNAAHDLNGCAGGCPYTSGFSIHDNILEDLGSYGITYKSVNGPNNYIYNNTVKVTGRNEGVTGHVAKQGIGLQYFYNSNYAEVYNNWIEKTQGAGIKAGEAPHLIHDNTILGCGTGNSSFWGHGIAIFESDHMPNRSEQIVKIYKNTIVESIRYGIRSLNATGYHYKNIIAESGIGEAFSYGTLTEGTGTDANIYEADADDVGFKVWIDDGDYSNDDFSLIGSIPSPTDLQLVY